ncbi:MAG TPA: pyruvate dehydrogenase (acetyl-transferring) E1 component subunit alpha [Ktedonobacteraceae bacterium]
MNTEQKEQHEAKDTTASSVQGIVTLSGNEERARLLHYYYQMVLIRLFEEKTSEMYTKAHIGGYCHLNLGEEATVVGFCAGLGPDDYVYTNYREHGYAIGCGITANAVMAELFGKVTGCSKGRGGSMHLFDRKHRFLGGYGIVGGQVPLAVGAAFAIAYHRGKEIVACQMGDGATNGGPFYESLNLAQIYHLPTVFFIVNNQYGMGLRVDQGSAVSELYRKGCMAEVYSERVDGTDVLAVRDAMRRAVEFARTQHEPYLLEAVSFRFRGHSVIDPDRYRSKEEVQRGRSRDPITLFAGHLKTSNLVDDATLQKLEEQAQREVDEAVRFAQESAFPPEESLYDYIYADEQIGA